MNEPTPQRPRFTLIQLFAAVTAICVLLGLGIGLFRPVREHGLQAQCRNNQRQLALGIHLYHDTNNQLPPLATDPDHWTWIALTLPYVESGYMYNSLTFGQPASSPSNRSLVVQYG